MLTNGVDPYNGSVSPLNQDSPYVQTAINDAQRAGIVRLLHLLRATPAFAVARQTSAARTISRRSPRAPAATPITRVTSTLSASLPYLSRFAKDVSQTYVASFEAPSKRDLLPLRLKTRTKGVKLRAPSAVRPGTVLVSSGTLIHYGLYGRYPTRVPPSSLSPRLLLHVMLMTPSSASQLPATQTSRAGSHLSAVAR